MISRTLNTPEAPAADSVHSEWDSRFRAQRFGPRTRPGLIGIEIDEGCVRIAQMEACSEGFRLRTAETIDWNTDASTRLRGLGRTIRQVVRSGRFAGDRVACLLPAADYQSDFISAIDGDGGRQSAEGIRRQFSRRNAAPSSNLVFDYWTAAAPGQSLEAAAPIQVVAVREELVEELAAELQSAGFQIHCIDAPMTVAARAARFHRASGTPGTVVVLDWGNVATSLTLVARGTPVLARSFRTSGFHAVVEAVSQGFQVSIDSARILLQSYGLPGPQQTTPQARIAVTIFGLLRDALRRFRDESERTIQYFRRKGSGGEVGRILLTSCGGALRHAEGWLADELGIPCEVWTQFADTSAADTASGVADAPADLPAEMCRAAMLSVIPFDGGPR